MAPRQVVERVPCPSIGEWKRWRERGSREAEEGRGEREGGKKGEGGGEGEEEGRISRALISLQIATAWLVMASRRLVRGEEVGDLGP